MAMVSFRTTVNSQAIPIDKQKHFAAGVIIGGMSASDVNAKYPFWNAVLFSTMAGVGKEFMDIGSGVPEVNDALATVAGGVIGGAIVYGIRKKIDRIKYYGVVKHRRKKRRR